ncbi:hypothetical protein CKO35_05260 [Ectothiorhodospira shaposhnikovii]|uniref:PilY2 family type 4a fimbrial biogenesis protein n=1 Tax=Ectothiorhodospira shaposhnikovii TaxID=1054 RepID=UPI001904D8B9|nr:hypothetical protein [Ectothiorhodospira shaposhnikovii]MBK1672717.1 hypothetical protein [Ectothiorhodospira shaposhnikovii]
MMNRLNPMRPIRILKRLGMTVAALTVLPAALAATASDVVYVGVIDEVSIQGRQIVINAEPYRLSTNVQVQRSSDAVSSQLKAGQYVQFAYTQVGNEPTVIRLLILDHPPE